MVCSADGTRRLDASESAALPSSAPARLSAAAQLGTRLAARLVVEGAAELAPLASARTLAGWTVVVPRAGAWGVQVGALLRARGARALVLPLVEFAPAADLGALDRSIDALGAGTYGWLAVTSATTVDALAERVSARGLGTLGELLPERTRVAAIGPATARALGDHGAAPALVATDRSAAGLAERLASYSGAAVEQADAAHGNDGPRTVLAPHSDLAGSTLAEGLRAAGWTVDEVVAYRTVTGALDPADAAGAWSGEGPHAVLLTSPSTARAVVELLGPPPAGTLICCLGPRTAEYARRQGLAVDVVAEDPSVENLVLALVRHTQEATG